jgi:hypothetical protein
MPNTSRLMVEALEDRCVPSSLGQTWPEPGHLTLSFVPDGTLVGGAPSTLFAKLNRIAPTAQWQQVILRAFQTWAVNTNVNVGIVGDDGEPVGTDGAVQGDPRFGDIRVAMQALPENLVATTSPFSWTGSTWSGDVILNSSYKFTLGGATGWGGYDLFTVATHEAGHALGIPDNTTDRDSIMYANYTGPRSGLDGLDISNVQTLYGARTPDASTNDTLATATPLGNSPAELGFRADLATTTDVDYYKIVTPLLSLLGPANVTIQIDTAGLSGLVPTLSIYNAAGQLVASRSGSSPLDGDVGITLSNVAPLTTYYFAVSQAQTGVFGIGAYTGQITYNYLLSSIVGIVPPLIPGVVNTAQHLNTSIASATMLTAPWGAASDQRFNYLYQANLAYGGDADYYKFQAPAAPAPTGSYALDAIVWQTEPGGLAPALHLFDSSGNPVAAEVMTDTAGVFALQVRGVAPGTLLYVEVAGQTNSGPASMGGYVYGARFNTMPETVAPPLGSNTLPTASSTDTGVLAMNQNGVFYFELAAAAGGSSAADLTMTVVDTRGHVALSLTAAAGAAPRTTAAYLPAGTYTIDYSISAAADPTQPTTYWLFGKILSNPIGPYYSGSNPPPSSSSTTSPSANGNATTSATTTFASDGAAVSINAPDGSTMCMPIPAPGDSSSQTFTTSAGTTTVTMTTDADGNTTLTLTTPSANTITDSVTTSGSRSTETMTTSDGIQVTINTPGTTPAPSYAGPSSAAPSPYYY